MSLSNDQQKQLADDAAKARQFAFGVQQYWQAYKANGDSVEGLKTPAAINTDFEWAGWKLADRLQHVRLDTKS